MACAYWIPGPLGGTHWDLSVILMDLQPFLVVKSASNLRFDETWATESSFIQHNWHKISQMDQTGSIWVKIRPNWAKIANFES